MWFPILTLSTLDPRQLAAGIAEVIKYGLIRDLKFFSWLGGNIERLLRYEDEFRVCDPGILPHMAQWWPMTKERLVKERSNLDTFGHAIEAATIMSVGCMVKQSPWVW